MMIVNKFEELVESLNLKVWRERGRRRKLMRTPEGTEFLCVFPCDGKGKNRRLYPNSNSSASMNRSESVFVKRIATYIVCCLSRARYLVGRCVLKWEQRFRNFWWRCHKFWSRSWLMRSYRYSAVNFLTSRQKSHSFFSRLFSISFSLPASRELSS